MPSSLRCSTAPATPLPTAHRTGRSPVSRSSRRISLSRSRACVPSRARRSSATTWPHSGDAYWAPPPRRPFADEVGADPGRLRIAFTTRTPDGGQGHQDCVAALADAAALCESLGHELGEADLPGLDELAGAAIGTVFNATTSWVVRYSTEPAGRAPAP